MSSGAIDPIAVTKRVFYRPSDAGVAIVLSPGDAVCYKLDAVDHKERTVDPVHLGLARDTYAEGEQEMTGRLFSVEEPLIDNIDQFAGIVKSLGPKAGADGDMIEIFKANSGAVVPVNLAASITTVVGRTLLAVVVGQRTLGNPISDFPDWSATAGSTDSKVVGIAMEVRTTTGKCWVKLDENQFMHQGGQIGQEFQIAIGTTNVAVNKMNLSFLQTDGHCQALHYRGTLSAAGADCNKGMFRFETIVDAVTSLGVIGLTNRLDITASTPGNTVFFGLKSGVRSRVGDPDLRNCTVTPLCLEYILTKASGGAALDNPPSCGCMIFCNTDTTGSLPDYFLYGGVGALSYTADTTGTNQAGAIKINVGGAVQYFHTFDNVAGAT